MKDRLQAIALGLCLVAIAAALTASGTFGAGPARAFGQVAAPVPATPEAAPVKLPKRPDRVPITCARLRAMGAGVLYLERFGCYPAACLVIVQRQVDRRAELRAARKPARP